MMIGIAVGLSIVLLGSPGQSGHVSVKELKQDFYEYKRGLQQFRFTVRYLLRRFMDNKVRQLQYAKERELQKIRGKELEAKLRLIAALEKKLKEYSGKRSDPFWTPELLWRLGVLYYDIAMDDEGTAEFQKMIKNKDVAAAGVVPAKMDSSYYQKKALHYFSRIIKEFPNFRNILTVKYILMRLYEDGVTESDDDYAPLWGAKIAFSIVCHNLGYDPYNDDLDSVLKDRMRQVLPQDLIQRYVDITQKMGLEGGGLFYLFNVRSLDQSDIKEDPFWGCAPPEGPPIYVAWAWLTLGKFFSTYAYHMSAVEGSEAKQYLPIYEESDIPQGTPNAELLRGYVRTLDIELTNWISLMAYRRILADQFRRFKLKPYAYWFMGVALDRTSAPSDLTMSFFLRALEAAYAIPPDSPERVARNIIPLVIKYMVALLYDPIGTWSFVYDVKCDQQKEEDDQFYASDCIMKRIGAVFQRDLDKPFMKDVYTSLADVFYEYGDQSLLVHFLTAYRLYKYVFFNKSMDGGWKYYSKKPIIFYKLKAIMDFLIDKLESEIEAEAQYNDERRKRYVAFREQLIKERENLSSRAVNEIFTESEVDNFLANKELGPKERRELADLIRTIRRQAMLDKVNALQRLAQQYFKKFKDAKDGAAKERFRAKARELYTKLIKSYLELMRDFKGSSTEYDVMWLTVSAYLRMADLAKDKEEEKKYVLLTLSLAREVRDSLISDEHKKDAAALVIDLYLNRLGLGKTTVPWKGKDGKNHKFKAQPRPLTPEYQALIKDIAVYLKLFPDDELVPKLEQLMVAIYFSFMQMDKGRALAWKYFEKYCPKDGVQAADFAGFIFGSYQNEIPAPEQEEAFKRERDEAFSRLEKAKCKGDDKKLRKFATAIGLLKLQELIDLAKKEYKKATASRSDVDQWKRVDVVCGKAIQKIESRKDWGDESKKMEENLFGLYWYRAEAKEAIGDYKGAFDIYYNKIYKNEKMYAYAVRQGYKEILLSKVAEAAENFFKEKLAEEIWLELTKEGRWRVVDPKTGKVRTKRYSQFRYEAWERLLALHMAWEDYRKALGDLDQLISLSRGTKPMVGHEIRVPPSASDEVLARALGISASDIDKYSFSYLGSEGGMEKYAVTDKYFVYTRQRLDIALRLAFRRGASIQDVQHAMEQVDAFMAFLKERAGGSLFDKSHERLWQMYIDALYTKMKLVDRLRRIYRRYKKWSKVSKLEDEYVQYLSEYKKLFEKGRAAGLNVGTRFIYYGEAVLRYAKTKFVKIIKNPFPKRPPTVFNSLATFAEELQKFVEQLRLSGEQLQKKIMENNQKIQELSNKYRERAQFYSQEIVKFVKMAQQLKANPALFRDPKFRKEYLRLNEAYGKRLIALLNKKVQLADAMRMVIAEQKDLKKIMKDIKKLQEENKTLAERATKSSTQRSVDFSKKYAKVVRKELEKFKRLADELAPFMLTEEAKADLRKQVEGKYEAMKKELDALKLDDPKQVMVNASVYYRLLNQIAKLTVLYRSAWLMDVLEAGYQGLQQVSADFDVTAVKDLKGEYRRLLAAVYGNLQALTLKVLGDGLSYYDKAPYPEEYFRYLWDHKTNTVFLDDPDLLPEDWKGTEATGKEWWEDVADSKGYAKATLETYLDYQFKRFYRANFKLEGQMKKKAIPMVEVERLYKTVGLKLRDLVIREGVWSQLIEEALRGFASRYPDKKVPPPEPQAYLVEGAGR